MIEGKHQINGREKVKREGRESRGRQREEESKTERQRERGAFPEGASQALCVTEEVAHQL